MAPSDQKHDAASGGSDSARGRGGSKWLLWAGGALLVTLVALAVALGIVYRGPGPRHHDQAAAPAATQVRPLDLNPTSVATGEATTLPAATSSGILGVGTAEAPTSSTPAASATVTTTSTKPVLAVNKPDIGIPNTADGNTVGEKVLGVAAAIAIASGAGGGDGACRVMDGDELRTAITEKTCPVIILVNTERDAYVILEEIIVRRSVVIMGNSVTLPYLDCAEAVRAFRVVAGGYLELQFVRVNIGQGEVRPRVGIFRDRNLQTDEEEEVWREMTEEDYEAMTPEERAARKLQLGGQGAEAPPLSVIEIRGGTVLFEAGCIGGTFTGVYFTSDQTGEEDVRIAIEQTVNLVGIRMWGGHVMVVDGDVSFNGCIFYDLELLMPFSDRIYFGGDVLVLAGTARFTACAWFYTTIIGAENGLGFNTAVFGGVAIFTACHFQEQNLAAIYNGVGQAFIVLGGVQIVTGCNFIYWSVLEFFSGTGELTVLAGVQVATGVTWTEFYGLFTYYGAGLDYAVLAGVMVMTGTTLNQWSGPVWGAIAGDYVFVGSGSFTSHGGPIAEYASIGGESGSGDVVYVATGTAVFIATPVFDVSGIWTTFAIGEYFAVGSGFLVIIGSPLIEYSGIEYFQGLGGTCFLGAGAVVMGWSPQVEAAAIKNDHFDFWFMGSCEPDHSAWAPGKPFYIAPKQGCIEHEDHADGRIRARREMQGARSLAIFPELDVLAVNVSKTRLRLDDEAQMQFLASINTPTGLIDTARNGQIIKEALGIVDKEAVASSFYIHDKREGYCGLCGVGSVSGPGAESCDVTASCDDLDTPFGKAGSIDFNALDYKEHFVIAADLDAVVPRQQADNNDALAPAKLTPEDVKQAVAEILAEEGDGLETLQVTVHDAQADPILKARFPEYFPDLHDRELRDFHRRMAVQEDDAGHRFTVSVVATSRERYDAILGKMQPQPLDDAAIAAGELPGGDSELEAAVRDYLQAEKGVNLTATRLTVGRTLYVPAYNSEELFGQGAVAPKGAFSVSIHDPTQPAAPVTHPAYGIRYLVAVDNFPPNAKVSIKLHKLAQGASAPTSAATAVSYTLAPALELDADGKAHVPYTFPSFRHAPGDYYVKVTDLATGAYNFSPIFTLATGRRRRTLYGPVMWV